MIGDVDFWFRFTVPMEQAMRLYREKVHAEAAVKAIDAPAPLPSGGLRVLAGLKAHAAQRLAAWPTH